MLLLITPPAYTRQTSTVVASERVTGAVHLICTVCTVHVEVTSQYVTLQALTISTQERGAASDFPD